MGRLFPIRRRDSSYQQPAESEVSARGQAGAFSGALIIEGATIGQGDSRQRNPGENPRKASNISKEQNAMKPAVDQERAERVIATLKRVQFSPVTTAITELATLSRDLAPR